LNFWSLDCENGDDEEYDTFVDICCEEMNEEDMDKEDK